MTPAELASLVEGSRRRVTRLGLTAITLVGVVALGGFITIWAGDRGYLSSSGFVRVIAIGGVAGIAAPAWSIWTVYHAQANGGVARCPHCRASLVRQGSRLLQTGRCLKCGAEIARGVSCEPG